MSLSAETLARYDLRVPRYTSYPTAPHFTPAVDGGVYRRWLEALPVDRALSLYVHVPFCAAMCWFCGCHTKVARRYEPIAAYLELLRLEIGRVADILGAPFPVRHLHWGGGTPTMLSAEDFVALTGYLRERFDFLDGAEIAVEIDPRVTTDKTIAGLAEAGVTRASLGVQDFDPRVQKAINRHQSFELTAHVSDGLRAAGIHEINLDLLYGLPHQTPEGVARTMAQALTLAPARIALFGYAHVPWMKRHQRLIDEAALPDPVDRLRQFEAAADELARAGYVAVGLDHFAHPADAMAMAQEQGRLHRNFQGYTTDEADTLLGFGVSAIGSLPGGYVQNTTAMPVYRDALTTGDLPVARGIETNTDDRLRRDIIECLMCEMEVDLAAVCARHGATPATLGPERALLARLQADGIVSVTGTRLAMTDQGKPLVRAVCAVFDTYLRPGETRHAQAV